MAGFERQMRSRIRRARSPLPQGALARLRRMALRAARRHGHRARPPEWRRPRRLASAPASIDTVAAFRPWRSFRSSVARGRRGHHGNLHSLSPLRMSRRGETELAERGGFEPPKRGLDAYTLSRRAPSTTRTPLRWTGNSSRPGNRRQQISPAAPARRSMRGKMPA